MLPHVYVQAILTKLLYPPACALCHARCSPDVTIPTANRAMICEECTNAMPRNGPPVCVRCGLELPGAYDATMHCSSCRTTPPVFDAARAPWQYAGTAGHAVRQFKYHRRWRIGHWLAEEMTRTARASLPLADIDAILPVPSHWFKRWLKGWEPVESLAKTVSGSLGKPCLTHHLRRTRWTKTQTRLRWQDRAQNVRAAFSVAGGTFPYRTVVLIDDVLTSGATANACARALKAAGAHRVFILAAARTPLHE